MADKNVKASKAAKPASNILRVTDPNDKRLKMYEDSSLATGRAEGINRRISELRKMPEEKRANEILKGAPAPKKSLEAIKRLEKANKKPYSEGDDMSNKVLLKAPKGYGYKNGGDTRLHRNPKGDLFEYTHAYGKNRVSPQREVILEKKVKKVELPASGGGPQKPKEEPPEKLKPRIDTTRISTPEREIVAPVLRPIPKKEPVKEKNIGMGSSLRYPSQGFLAKMKRRITGEPNAAYWVDKEGTKRYPSRGENNPQAVREKEMLTKGLNPRNSDDKAALDKVDTYFKKSAK